MVECVYTKRKKEGATPIKSWFLMAPLANRHLLGAAIHLLSLWCRGWLPPSQPTKITTLQVGSMLLTSWALDSLHYTKKNGATWVRWVVYFGGWDPFTKLSNFEVDAGEVVVISRGPWQKKWEMWSCVERHGTKLRSIFEITAFGSIVFLSGILQWQDSREPCSISYHAHGL